MNDPSATKLDLRRRVGYILLGLAIGFLALGVFQYLRAQEAAKRQTPGVAPK